ncbi:MAG: hypothetical protein HYX68_01020 [Planctomycetes bacterium]|nr:hypothetical protein [Planctomycetota bacterium]
MNSTHTQAPLPLPGMIKALGSLFAVGHLASIGLLALGAASGPWLMANGQPSPAEGPDFAVRITMKATEPYYLRPLRMTHNYHFETNRPAVLGIFFEVKLKDQAGEVIQTITIPDPKANFWVRHRQGILAHLLAQDQALPRRGTEVLAPKGQEMPKVDFWDKTDMENWQLKTVEEHLLPREVPFERPSEESKKLAQAYLRHLCRKHNAASAELIRHHQPQVRPERLLLGPQAGDFTIYKSHFGEFRRDD